MTEQDEVRILYNESDNITYFVHHRKDGQEFVSIDKEEIEKAIQIENSIIVVIVPNDIHDPNKGVNFYGLSAVKWLQHSEVRNGKCTVPLKILRNLEGFNI